ncbi:single-strand binding protein [Noviherbaspirillum humi]|uniref:Single-stranded DNA-binding protein n=1 Tax=Noviherbaspirillum humi TaxID=1688639 RepID=A0A239HZV0_9BURK|nr:single-stranded DNA-binding protein [Noviherbaspirillum humi]SNS86263.1 single-strand binding protein [Noviherbaspirillum humi]
MATLNKVTLIGYLGHAPELRYTNGGDPVAHFTLATTETWKDKATGEKKEATEWHRIVMYRKLAEISGEFLKKGSLVYIEGKLQSRKWTGKDGVERVTVEIIADDMRMLGGRHAGHEDGQQAAHDAEPRHQSAPAKGRQPQFEYEDDAIPF